MGVINRLKKGRFKTMEIKSVNASRGLAWYGEGWKIVRSRLGIWVLLALSCCFIGMVLNIIPFVGALVFSIIMPGVTAGLFKAAQDWQEGVEPSFGYLSIAFKDPAIRNRVLTLGVISIGFNILTTAIIFLTIGGLGMNIFMYRTACLTSLVHLAAGAAVAFVLILLLAFLFASAMLYAVPLVMLTGTEPIEAMKLSINACIKNVLSMTVYGIIYIFLCILTMFTFGLGLIILMPLTITSIYISFKDIFSGNG